MNIEEKVPLNIGLFGHIDSGKTEIAKCLSEIISTAGIDAHPQSKERGITIDLGFTSFMLNNYLVTLVDAPGHADLIKISASSLEIIDLALMVIDINKGPQIQTGEHLIMIDSLGISDIIVVLNKVDLFEGNIQDKIEKTRKFFATTSFGAEVPIYIVSAKEGTGFEELKEGLLGIINSLTIERDYEGDVIIPIDHHFIIKGRGAVITGTLVSGKLSINQQLTIIPINSISRVKNIQIFHQNVESARAGHRVGINLKNIEIKNIFRGCYATDNVNAFDISRIFEIKGEKTDLFKHETTFGTQLHITIGMDTSVGKIYPFEELEGKKLKTSIKPHQKEFKAILILNERTFIRKERNIMLLSRLDLPPTTLRILGSAKLIKVYDKPPLFYKYKIKTGKIDNPTHPQGIICTGLAQSIEGARKMVGRELELPFSKVIDTFGTKGAVIVGIEDKKIPVQKNEEVVLKELRSFKLTFD
jgi:selenocysteine-specific elongation factor